MGILLTDILSNLTNAHKRIIRDLVEQNPASTLHDLSTKLNNMPEMMTCHTEISVEILQQLGHTEPAAAIIDPDSEKTKVVRTDEVHRTLSVEVLRKQLERRHAKIQARIETLLDEETISSNELKTVDMLAKIDDGICSKLMDLMGQESTPVLPQAIIVACLRRHGVPDEDILTIEDFRVVA